MQTLAAMRRVWRPNGSLYTATHHASSAAIESLKLDRFARRRMRFSSAVESLKETSNDVNKQQPIRKSRFNVHHYVVQQKMPLIDVLPMLQSEVQNKTLKAAAARQAVDSFYFHCAQEAEKKNLPDEFRWQVLQYFDHKLFEDESKPFELGKSLNEAVFGSIIKLHLAGGDTEAAWTLINKLRRAVRRKKEASKDRELKLHFRTVSPLLEHECRHGKFPSAYSKWQELKQDDVEWTSAMEDVLVQMVIACLKNNEQVRNKLTTLPEREASAVVFHSQMATLLHDLQLTCREVSPANAKLLMHAFQDTGFIVKPVPSDGHMKLQCPCCGHALNKQKMTNAERTQMLTAIESRRSKVSPQNPVKEFLEPFRDWLMHRQENFLLKCRVDHIKNDHLRHYVLDGPNIAYMNQNFGAGTYRLDQVDAVAKDLQTQGHLVSITMPASYLADKFVVRIRTKYHKAMRRQGKFVTRERTAEEKVILARWYEQDMIYSCRTDFLSDDIFWLYASVLLGDKGRVVTNDQGRDHVFALLNGYTSTCASARPQTNGKRSGGDGEAPLISMDLVSRWKDMTTVNIELKHEEKEGSRDDMKKPIESIHLFHPRPFSRVPQVTAPWHFHVPIADQANQHEHPNQVQHVRKRTRWLCAHRHK